MAILSVPQRQTASRWRRARRLGRPGPSRELALRRCIAIAVTVWIACQTPFLSSVAAQQRDQPERPNADVAAPADYRSRHFLMHTDLPPEEANELLGRLETMLTLISDYWGRPPSGVIECYVVRNLDQWPPASMAPEGRARSRGERG